MELTAEQLEELAALSEELEKAEARAGAALGSMAKGHPLEGEAAARFEEADNEVAELRSRIKEIENPR